ncbi:MAG TPA: hypothetical protein VHQ21_01520 [Rhodanobacteraceae bacterium]|nr:hypothetical protein [Rhodanobacteraceae bacterium]
MRVIPAKAGIQFCLVVKRFDSALRRNDEAGREFRPICGQNTARAPGGDRAWPRIRAIVGLGRLAVYIDTTRSNLNRRPGPHPRKAANLAARVYHAPPFCPFIRICGWTNPSRPR